MNYILGCFLLGTVFYCWKKFHAREHDSLWIQLLCGLMGIISFLTAAPANGLLAALMLLLAVSAAACCYFQCRSRAQKRIKKALFPCAVQRQTALRQGKEEPRPLRKAV